ncbi:hypothetical protein ACOMHN_057299 [Nucella lapillus]
MPGKKVTPDDGELRVVVVGREGHGKSTVCNALLGSNHFTAGTKTTASDVGECSKAELKIKVIDTPDISDNDMKQKDKKEEVNRWKELAAPYTNILLLCIKGDAPYTEEDFIAYRQVRRFWGGRGSTKDRLVVVFTFCEGQDVSEVGDRMEADSPKWMAKIFEDSGGRYIVLKGKGAGNLLDEVMNDDDSDDEEEEEEGGRKGSGKGRKGSGKGRKGSGKGRRGSHGSQGSHGECHGHKPKGGRGRRQGHSGGKKRGHHEQGGIWGIFCCCCTLLCKGKF